MTEIHQKGERLLEERKALNGALLSASLERLLFSFHQYFSLASWKEVVTQELDISQK